MSTRTKQPPAAPAPKARITGAEVKTRLRERGETLRSWAAERGYPYGTVSDVVRGINRATFGLGHRIAVELGLKQE